MIGKFLRKLRFSIFTYLGKRDPRNIAKVMYFEAHHKFLNLKHPENLDEKINWMKFNSDTSLWSRLADKYEVRSYIQEQELEYTLNEVYGIYDSVEDIDLSELPNSFVLKATNGSGGSQVLIVEDKSKFDWGITAHKIQKWLDYTAPYMMAEPHYSNIRPRIMAEKLLHDSGSQSLIDYKFHCFNGHVESCLVCAERHEGHAVKSIYDLQWNIHPEYVLNKYKGSPVVKKPRALKEMIALCSKLSKGFPYVRVDFYEIDGKPVFSEMTFTPAGGYNKTMTLEYLERLGKLFKLPDPNNTKSHS